MGDAAKGDERAKKPHEMAQYIQEALVRHLPGIEKLIMKAVPKYEKMIQDTSAKIAPQQQMLQHGLYKKFAPAEAKIQNQLLDIYSQGTADSFEKHGIPTFQRAEAAARGADPEFYANRANLGARFQHLMDSPMSEGEIESMVRGARKMNINAGGADVVGNTNTAANAMLFGERARNRNMENLGLVSSALPNLRTTTAGDVFGMGNSLGKHYDPNLFTRDYQLNEGGSVIGNNLMGNLFGVANTGMNVNANRRTVTDHASDAYAKTFGTSIPGCWVARVVFGEDSAKWLLFWYWMRNEGPVWFKKLYLKYGKSVAKFISNKPKLKIVIRSWMESKINE